MTPRGDGARAAARSRTAGSSPLSGVALPPPSALAALLAVSVAACAHVPPGIRTERADRTDRVAVKARPAGWRRVAVAPFGGDPAHARPAEELAALWVQRAAKGLEVATPWAIGVAARRAAGGAPPLEPDAWALAYLEPEAGSAPPREAVRAAAGWLRVDAVVVGRVAPGGVSADVVLVDAASGEAVAAIRRAGSRYAAELGVHELAMDATRHALAGLVEVLRTPPGQVARIALPSAPALPDPGGEVPP